MVIASPVAASAGLMLESTAEHLCEKGGAHHGSPDKVPALRIASLEAAGRACVPTTSGILIGIGETRRERIESLLVIRALALGRVTTGNFRRLIRKELVVALLNGLVWGGIAGALTFLLYQGTPIAGKLALTMMLAMLLNLLIGALIGVAVPLLLDRFGRDPAIGSSVLLTFSTDSLGFMLFLGLATVLFRS